MNWKLHQLEWHICVLIQEKERKRQRQRQRKRGRKWKWPRRPEFQFGCTKRLVSESKSVSNSSIT